MRRRLSDDSGQVLVLSVLFLPVLLILAGFVIDYGQALVLQRKAQAAADASALAAVWSIPSGLSAVQATASSIAAVNSVAGLDALPDVSQVSSESPNDSVKVQVNGGWATVFAKVFGLTTMSVHASATATAQGILGCSGHGCDALPWGIPDCAIAGSALDCSRPLAASFGQRVTLKTDDGTGGNFNALSNPQLRGARCTSPSGAGDYSDSIVGVWAPSGAAPCNIRTAGGPTTGYSTSGCDHRSDPSTPTCVVQVKTGNMVGPTANGLQARLGCNTSGCNSDSFSYVTGGCNPAASPTKFCPIVHDSPRIVVVPIVRNLDNSAGYASCSSGSNCYVKIVDLVYFFIDAPAASLSGSTVTGTFFRSTAPPSFDLLGPYTGGSLLRAHLSG